MREIDNIFHFEENKPNFETLAKQNGFTYWYASDLMRHLGYASIEAFAKPVQKAIATCVTLNIEIMDNFVQEKREEDGVFYTDYRLSRFACYLVTMNADTKKPEVAKAQAFFATSAEAFRRFVEDGSDVERVLIRDDISTQEKSLGSVATQSGVTEFGFFKDAGYRGLYNMSLKQIKQLKNIPTSTTIYDVMGREEMAANLFRLTQTEATLIQAGNVGQRVAEKIANDVGKTVRNTMVNKPEDLPTYENIKKVKSALKSSQKEFKKIDSKKNPTKDSEDL
jgi:DNA-damage-inducible protein D